MYTIAWQTVTKRKISIIQNPTYPEVKRTVLHTHRTVSKLPQ